MYVKSTFEMWYICEIHLSFVCWTTDFGEEKSLALSNKNSEQVMKALEFLVNDGEK